MISFHFCSLEKLWKTFPSPNPAYLRIFTQSKKLREAQQNFKHLWAIYYTWI